MNYLFIYGRSVVGKAESFLTANSEASLAKVSFFFFTHMGLGPLLSLLCYEPD